MDDVAKKRQEHLDALAAELPAVVKREELDQYAAFLASVCGSGRCSVDPEVKERIEGQKEQFPAVWQYIEAKVSAIRSPQIGN